MEIYYLSDWLKSFFTLQPFLKGDLLKCPQTVPPCWPRFELTCWPTCWRGLLYYIFPSKKQPIFLDFHSFACWLSIKNVGVWNSSMFDNHPRDRWWWQENTWLNKKVDTAKRGRTDVTPCSGVTGWGYKDTQRDDENELQII